MDYILNKYLPRVDFESYEDFKENYKVNVPDNFNFGFDVVDAWAEAEPSKRALVWCNEETGEKYEEYEFSFSDIKERSNQMCNYFLSLGLKKGDRVMLIMKRRYEYWMTATALHKLGIVSIPATFQLTEKDLIYRINAANVKMIVCALGYNQDSLEYPQGFINVAADIGLLKGLAASDNVQGTDANRGAIAKLIDNMMDAETITSTGKYSSFLSKFRFSTLETHIS